MSAKLAVMLLVIAGGCVQGFSTYRGNFSLDYPSGWNSSATSAGTFFTGVGDFPPTLRVSEFEGSIEEAASRAKQLQSRLKDYALVAEENIAIAGKRALRRTYSWTDAAHGISFTQMQAWTEGGFLLTATSQTGGYEQNEPLFYRMIGSFRS